YPCAIAPSGYAGPFSPCPGFVPTLDASGQSFLIPKWQFAVGSRVDFDVGPGDLGAQLDYAWHDKIPSTVLSAVPVAAVQSTINDMNAARGLLSGRVDYTLPETGLTFAVFGTNLANEKYDTEVANLLGFTGYYSAAAAEPRMWGVSVRKTFGTE